MHPPRISKKPIVIASLSAVMALACSAQTAPQVAGPVGGKADDPACEGAAVDSGGYCRLPSGRFASFRCCEREYLAGCIAETEECLGQIEDEFYADSCGVNQSGEFCVSDTHCPDWVFDDPERTPHEILGVDITEQCEYVCENGLLDCMYDRGYDDDLDYDGAFETCVAESGCASDLCDTDSGLCQIARENFEDARGNRPEPTEPTEPTEPEMWTLERCAIETEECVGHIEDDVFFSACGDTIDSTVCINEESCPPEVFSDPARTPLEVLGIDISEQCEYVCEAYLPDCMYEAGYDAGLTLADAFATCIEDSGCRSDVCDTDRSLCDDAEDSFDSARN